MENSMACMTYEKCNHNERTAVIKWLKIQLSSIKIDGAEHLSKIK